MSRMRTGWVAIALGALAIVIAGLLWARRSAPPPAQPVAFDHALHLRQKLACADCHVLVETAEKAGLPTANLCMTCHQVIKTGSPEVQKVAQFQKARRPIPWVRLYQVPDFVYFNHSRHIKAGMKCSECHGNTGATVVSVTEKEFAMATCVDCHTMKKASNDCLTCHK